MSNTLTELAEYLRSRVEAIVDRWRQACEADDALEVVSRLTRSEFRNSIPDAIEALCGVLAVGTAENVIDAIRTDVAKHGHHRWKQGFSLRQLIRDWGRLTQVLIATIEEFFHERHPQDSADRTTALDRLALFVTEATSSSVQRFDELRRAEAASLATDLEAIRQEFERVTRVRGQLLREAVHDLRGGLSAISGASAILKFSQGPSQSLDETLDLLDRSVDSLKDMLNSLLDLARLESGADSVQLLSVNIAEVLEELAAEHSTVARAKGLRLRSEGPRELFVRTDPQMVRRIAQNLLVNALQHTSSGEIRLSWKSESRRWLLSISDTGPGIQGIVGSPVAQELNEPDLDRETSELNVSRPHRGEGIGLTIVKRLCDLLEAGISLESEMGRGTTFTVQFSLDSHGE